MAVSMDEAISTLRNVIENANLNNQYDEEEHCFVLNFALDNTKLSSLRILVYVEPYNEDADRCCVFTGLASIDLKANEDNIIEVSEFLHRANFGMRFGRFELDYSNGEILFRVDIDCSESLPGAETIADLWVIPILNTEEYGDGLLAVSMGLLTPEEAIERIEAQE